jgi:mono/diheme cytochrome c family protein
MVNKRLPGIAVLLTTLFFTTLHFPVAGRAQSKKSSRVPPANRDSGEQLYKRYCAVCHGNDLKGNGPISPEYENPPADLTTLAQRHKNEFPDAYVEKVLRNGLNKPAHGNTEMPVWGPVFASTKGGDPQIVTTRILNLTKYIKIFQVKSDDAPSF